MGKQTAGPGDKPRQSGSRAHTLPGYADALRDIIRNNGLNTQYVPSAAASTVIKKGL